MWSWSKCCSIISMLSYPIRQRKGGASLGIYNLIFGFRPGKCGCLLHLQVVRRRRQWQLAQKKTPEMAVSGVFTFASLGYNLIAWWHYIICRSEMQYSKFMSQWQSRDKRRDCHAKKNVTVTDYVTKIPFEIDSLLWFCTGYQNAYSERISSLLIIYSYFP